MYFVNNIINVMETTKLTKDLVDLLKARGREVEFHLGETVVEEGKEADKVYIIEKGYVNVLKRDPMGNQVLVGTAGPGSIIGEAGIFMDTDRTATVKAVSDVKALSFNREEFLQAISEFPQLSYYIIYTLVRRLSHLNSRLVNVVNSKLMVIIGNYILDMLNDMDEIYLDVSAVSFETGIDQEKIIMTISNLARAGVIEDLEVEGKSHEEAGVKKYFAKFKVVPSRLKSYIKTISCVNL